MPGDLAAKGSVEIIVREGISIDDILEMLGVKIDSSKSRDIRDLTGRNIKRYAVCRCSKNE